MDKWRNVFDVCNVYKISIWRLGYWLVVGHFPTIKTKPLPLELKVRATWATEWPLASKSVFSIRQGKGNPFHCFSVNSRPINLTVARHGVNALTFRSFVHTAGELTCDRFLCLCTNKLTQKTSSSAAITLLDGIKGYFSTLHHQVPRANADILWMLQHPLSRPMNSGQR